MIGIHYRKEKRRNMPDPEAEKTQEETVGGIAASINLAIALPKHIVAVTEPTLDPTVEIFQAGIPHEGISSTSRRASNNHPGRSHH
jgi:hypothetical protein